MLSNARSSRPITEPTARTALRFHVEARLSACGKDVAHLPLRLSHGTSTPWIAFEPQ
jgi:hypothetical protein